MRTGLRMVLWLLAIAIAFGACALIVLAAAACVAGVDDEPVRGTANAGLESGWEITSFDANYVVDASGTVAVREQIDVDFHSFQKHGIFRDLFWRVDCTAPRIDTEERLSSCPDGRLRTYDIRVASVTDETGAVRTVESSHIGDTLRIKIGDADATISGKQTYIINYTVRGALDIYANHDELYWNASGQWPVQVLAFSARVTLPSGEMTSMACFQGTPSSSRACIAEASASSSATFQTTARLERRQQVTVLATFPHGIVTVQPTMFWHGESFRDFYTLDVLELGGASGVGLLAGLILTALWWRAGRDYAYKSVFYLTQNPAQGRKPLFGGPPVVVEFTPPQDLRPAQMGFLLDERPDTLDITATIVDLAVRGYLKIEEMSGRKAFSGGKDWRLTKLKDGDKSLLPFEQVTLDALFSEGLFGGKKAKEGKPVRLSELRYHFQWKLWNIREALYKDAAERKWFERDPRKAKAAWGAPAFALTLAGLVLCFAAGVAFNRALLFNAVPVAGLALVPLAHTMSRRTATGSESLRRILGFRLYIETAETRRQEFNEQSNIFARYLPYAIVFGSVTKWARAFSGLDDEVQQSLDWYSGGDLAHGFAVAAFSTMLAGMASEMNNTVSSVAPPVSSGGSSVSSSSSGFSSFGGGGGGFSGGGGGGGGGGSW